MTKALAVAAAAAVLGLASVACGNSDPDPPPAPAAHTPTPRATAAAPATESTPATEAAAATATPDEPSEPAEDGEAPLKIVTLLLPDAIPAIDRPRIISAEEGDAQLRLSDIVIGVSIDGRHRAYGAAFLSAHEIVNDTLGGRPIAVTW